MTFGHIKLVNLDEVAPLGKTSDFDIIIDELATRLYQTKAPMITCPKTFWGCGMCITKSKDNFSELFNKHTIDELSYEVVSQKKSNWYLDKTTKRAFMELDGEEYGSWFVWSLKTFA